MTLINYKLTSLKKLYDLYFGHGPGKKDLYGFYIIDIQTHDYCFKNSNFMGKNFIDINKNDHIFFYTKNKIYTNHNIYFHIKTGTFFNFFNYS